MLRALVLLGVALSLFVPTSGHAQNRLIPFQGKLTATGGTQIPDGNSSITFRIWDHPTDTAPARLKWTEPRTVFVQDGQVNLMLGTVTSLDSVDFSPPNVYYLGVTIGAGTEMAPRQQLVPSFHARSAETAKVAQSVTANTITNAAIQAGAITSTSIGDGEVKSTDIGAGEVVNSKLAANAVTTDKIAADAVETSDIKNGAVTVSKLDSNIQALITPPLQIVGALDLNAVPTLEVSADQLKSVETLALELTAIGGNTAALLPCANGLPPVQATIGGPSVTCGADKGVLGVAFNVTNPGTYEICLRATLALFVNVNAGDNKTGSVSSQWNIAETNQAGSLIQEAKAGRALEALSRSEQDNSRDAGAQVRRTIDVCRFLTFTSAGIKHTRLMYINEIIGPGTNNRIELSRPSGFSVRQIK